jgi:threonyl-tRNA synthetase
VLFSSLFSNRKFRQTSATMESDMVSVKLPDGSQRQFDAPVTVAQVAASIGAGLAKAALAGRVDGNWWIPHS